MFRLKNISDRLVVEMEFLLSEDGYKRFTKEIGKLRNLRHTLVKQLEITNQKKDTYVEERASSSLAYWEKQLADHKKIWDKKREELEAEEREAFESKTSKVEKARKTVEKQSSSKPAAVIAAEVSIQNHISNILCDFQVPTEQQQVYFPELFTDTGNTPVLEIHNPPPPVCISTNPRVEEYIKERGTAPVNQEELELFFERKEMLRDMAQKKREEEAVLAEKKDRDLEQFKLRKEQEEQERQTKRQQQVVEAASCLESLFEEQEDEEDDGWTSQDERDAEEAARKAKEKRLGLYQQKMVELPVTREPEPSPRPPVLQNTKVKKLMKKVS